MFYFLHIPNYIVNDIIKSNNRGLFLREFDVEVFIDKEYYFDNRIIKSEKNDFELILIKGSKEGISLAVKYIDIYNKKVLKRN